MKPRFNIITGLNYTIGKRARACGVSIFELFIEHGILLSSKSLLYPRQKFKNTNPSGRPLPPPTNPPYLKGTPAAVKIFIRIAGKDNADG